jgi:primosomal protein N'
MTRHIKCQRCTQQLKCLNCKSDLASAKFLGTRRYKSNLVADAIPIQGRGF